MRLNQYIAHATGLSRRAADDVIAKKRVTINGVLAQLGQEVTATDTVSIDEQVITPPTETMTIVLNKPVGYVCSRDGQGSKTIYDLLPPELHELKPVGRLDKDSSGLLLLTNDGTLAHTLTHPSFQKTKIYEVALDKPLQANDQQKIEQGVMLDDGLSALKLSNIKDNTLTVTMQEGRNRQIRRTFAASGYVVTKLHRIQFGPYSLNLTSGKFDLIKI